MKENVFTHYIRDEELYQKFKDAAREDKLPILDNKTFERMNAEYGKDKMRTNLADYIATERPVFPLKEITKEDDTYKSQINRYRAGGRELLI